MSLVNLQRNKARSGVRSTLALVFVAMLNLVVQPCSMAMEMDMDSDHPCPHCPESIGNNPESHAAPNLDASDCEIVESYSNDVRTGKFGQKNSADELPAIVDDLFSSRVPEFKHGSVEYSPPPCINSSGPPLNVLHCVYLK